MIAYSIGDQFDRPNYRWSVSVFLITNTPLEKIKGVIVWIFKYQVKP